MKGKSTMYVNIHIICTIRHIHTFDKFISDESTSIKVVNKKLRGVNNGNFNIENRKFMNTAEIWYL